LAVVDLQGKVFFITGGARGIGAAVAAEAARRGARIALAGLEPEELERRVAELGEGHAFFEADVTDLDSLRRAVDGTVETFGGIDLVLANAGIANYGTVEKGDPDAFLRTVDINLNGVYRTAHLTLPHLLKSRGWIGIVASIASFAPSPGMSSYNASKAGVELFTRSLRGEVGWRGVDAVSIHPSWIDTDLVRESEVDMPSFAEMRSKLPWPLKRTTSVEQCAQTIVDGIGSRRDRIFIPRSARLVLWVRNAIAGRIGEFATSRDASEMIPRMEAEIAALGRAGSARNAKINQLRSSGEVEPGEAVEPVETAK
jgi:NAD(P)-dependent dehydrogenase (short-subunit alcohol dehydrogenase family)